jgi:hypothetical protein
MSLELAKMVIGSTHEYWLVWRKNEHRDGERWVTSKATTWVISIPYSAGWRRGVNYDEMLVSEIDNLLKSEIYTNIPISEDYPPFQLAIYFSSFIGGIPITGSGKEAVKMLLNMKKSEFHEYKVALREFQEDKTKAKENAV